MYGVDYDSLNEHGIKTFIRFIEGLIRIYGGQNIGFHIKSYLDRYHQDANLNNNITFASLFEYLDNARIFYYNLLIMIYNRAVKYANTNILMETVLTSTIDNEEIIEDLFSKLSSTIKDYSNLNAANIFLATDFDCSIKSLKDHDCMDILFVTMARIMDYYTIFSIYKNIFDLQDNAYRPDYHIVINGQAHTVFLAHCFSRENNPTIVSYSKSVKAVEANNMCDITNILFPKTL